MRVEVSGVMVGVRLVWGWCDGGSEWCEGGVRVGVRLV